MIITACKTNHIVNPLGFAMNKAVVSWNVYNSISKNQAAAQVIVALDEEMKEIIFDSGKQAELSNLAVEIPITLLPRTRYYWIVKVWGSKGDEGESGVNWFETGKIDEEWKAGFITPEWKDNKIRPYMRKKFNLPEKVKMARAYVTGVGVYELEINGMRVGNEYLTPGCNAYDAWLQCQTYDITAELTTGENVIGALLGDGWAKGHFGTFAERNTPYCNYYALLCELHITLESGRKILITSDTDWECKSSAMIFDNIYDGEIYDARKEIPNWSTAQLEDKDWTKVKHIEPKELGKVTDRLSLPVMIKETLQPVELIQTPAKEQVLDMGQNMVGWLRIHINEPKDTEIKISFGEVLQEGNFYRDNLREAKQEYIYISDGKERDIMPHFAYYGFRYAKLEGFTNPIRLDDFTGCVVYSDLEETGFIETSDPYVNRLFLNAKWGQKGNFLDVPTDCPQRDERMGWTGDAQIFAGTASFNMDVYAFYAKFLQDVYEEQKFSDGMVPSVVPTFSKIKTTESSFVSGGACAWSDCATVIPWEMYLHYGDKSILERQYASMKAWVEWIRRKDLATGDKRLWLGGFQFGDWLALDGPVEGGVMGGTDVEFLASAYYKLSSEILSKAAKVLGKEEDAEVYGTLSKQIKTEIQNEFFSKYGRSTIKTQTAHVVALHFDLVPQKLRDRILNDLKEILIQDNMHLKTGFIGTPFLCRALSDNGASEIAYKLFFQEDYPSWLYEVSMGATTIWERWNSIMPDGKISGTGMNSLNHYAYGAIVEWMYRNMCGIQPLQEKPGFKEFVLKPEVYGKLRYAKAALKSPMGMIEIGWKLKADKSITIAVKVPFDSKAYLYLPDAVLDKVQGLDNLVAAQKTDKVKIELPAGSYQFDYIPEKQYEIKYSIASPIAELLSVPETREILMNELPNVAKGSSGDLVWPYSLKTIDDPFLAEILIGDADLEEVNQKLLNVPFKIRSDI